MFEEQAEATPDVTALMIGDETITYQELNRRANQMAHYLMKRELAQRVVLASVSIVHLPDSSRVGHSEGGWP